MGRWTQYDEDDYRLPYGFKRIGYDADTGKYTFQDRSGNTWNGAPHQQYGVMHYSGSAAAATIPPMIPSRPASADSLEEPWISVTEEMATPEHDSNPIDPLAFSQEPNRVVRRAKSIAARIRRRPSVPTATDDSPEGGDVESKTTTTRNVGVVRSASMEDKTPASTSTSAPRLSKTISHSYSKSESQREGSGLNRHASTSQEKPISRHKSSSHAPQLAISRTTADTSTPRPHSPESPHSQRSPPPVPPKDATDIRRRVTSPPSAYHRRSTSPGQAQSRHTSSSPSNPSADKSSSTKPFPDLGRTRLNHPNTDTRDRDSEEPTKPKGSSSSHRPRRTESQSQSQSRSTRRSETRHYHRRHVSEDDRLRWFLSSTD